MSNSVDPDETSHLNLCCLQKPIIIACGSERVKTGFCTIAGSIPKSATTSMQSGQAHQIL